MIKLLEKIDKYLVVQEKKDAISLSLDSNSDLKDVIEMVRKSDDKEKTISIFSVEIQEEIKKLVDGGIL
jgi:hypothetical protein